VEFENIDHLFEEKEAKITLMVYLSPPFSQSFETLLKLVNLYRLDLVEGSSYGDVCKIGVTRDFFTKLVGEKPVKNKTYRVERYSFFISRIVVIELEKKGI
jgi:hypothetical protein